MAKETRVEQVHPEHENEKIKAFERFGWEVVANQRCQEQKGDYIYTFNKITFSRDKSAPWYNRVRELEKEYGDILSRDYQDIKDKYGYEEKSGLGKKPIKPKRPRVAEPSVFLGCLCFFIICLVITLIFVFLGKIETFDYMLKDFFSFISKVGMVATGIGLLVTLINIQFLVGLKGKEKEEALKLYETQNAEFLSYEHSVKQFLSKREKEINKELDELLG
ncbi:MAG: DUF2721 domain-containing protein [Clostridiales bacterium]|nr:DUF2721 domain-containing protein [Clostridiales bacterium]